jgi:hypothetical protein
MNFVFEVKRIIIMTTEKIISTFVKQINIIFNSFLSRYGFTKTTEQIEKYNFTVIYRNKERYIEFGCALYPQDYNYYYLIKLGEGSNEFPEDDWNAVSLTRFFDEETLLEVKDIYGLNYKRITERFIRERLLKNKELLEKHASDFLSGDLIKFKKIRAEISKEREPYKWLTPDKNGKYQAEYDRRSLALKEKYSKE